MKVLMDTRGPEIRTGYFEALEELALGCLRGLLNFKRL